MFNNELINESLMFNELLNEGFVLNVRYKNLFTKANKLDVNKFKKDINEFIKIVGQDSDDSYTSDTEFLVLDSLNILGDTKAVLSVYKKYKHDEEKIKSLISRYNECYKSLSKLKPALIEYSKVVDIASGNTDMTPTRYLSKGDYESYIDKRAKALIKWYKI